MPLYEYHCNNCHRRVTILVRSSSQSPDTCPNCGGSELERRFSSFSMRKTDSDIYDDILSDRQLVSGLEANDPRALAEWNKRMSRGEEVAPEYEEMMEKMEEGEMPDTITPSEETAEE